MDFAFLVKIVVVGAVSALMPLGGAGSSGASSSANTLSSQVVPASDGRTDAEMADRVRQEFLHDHRGM